MALVFPASMPYDNINVIDQSTYSDAPVIVEQPFIPVGPTAFIPFISPRGYGKDNTLQYMSDSKLSKYGNPNLKKYGQSLYLAKRFSAGGGTVLGMRVTTPEMHHAHAIVVADTTDGKQCKYTSLTNGITGEIVKRPVFSDGEKEYVFDEIVIENVVNVDTISTIRENTTTGVSELESLLDKKSTYPTVSVKIDGTVQDLTIQEIQATEGTPKSLALVYTPSSGTPTTYTLVTADSMIVKYHIMQVTDTNNENIAADIQKIKNVVNAEYNASLNDGGLPTNHRFPLFLIAANGAGAYGNAFRFRITPDTSTNAVIDSNGDSAFCYRFIDKDGNSNLDSPFTFSFNDDYLFNNESMAIDEVFENYSQNITMMKLNGFDGLNGIISSANTDIADKADILFGTNIPNYYVDIYDDDAIDLSISTGINLVGGTDPSDTFTWSNDPFASALAKAYNGEIDDMIYDQVRYPYQFLFCPSMDPNVCDAVHNLAVINRKCTRVHYFVTGMETDVPVSYEDARLSREKLPDDTFKEDTIVEWARHTDPYTGRKTYFPSVYWNAYAIPYHWINRKGKPLAGPSHLTWDGFDVGTVMPRSSNPQQYIENHNARINTMIEDGLGRASMYEQITSQKTTSALSEINNSQILVDMIRIALYIASNMRWSDLGGDEVSQYKQRVESEISTQFKNCYDTMEVVAAKESENGAGANRVYCRINVKFKNILKGVSYDFYILAN